MFGLPSATEWKLRHKNIRKTPRNGNIVLLRRGVFILEVDYNLSDCSVWMCCYFIKQNNILALWKYSAWIYNTAISFGEKVLRDTLKWRIHQVFVFCCYRHKYLFREQFCICKYRPFFNCRNNVFCSWFWYNTLCQATNIPLSYFPINNLFTTLFKKCIYIFIIAFFSYCQVD